MVAHALKPSRLPAIGADLGLAAIFITLMEVEIWVFRDPDQLELGRQVAASVLSTLAGGALGFRRTHPLAAFAVNVASVVALIALTAPSDFYQFTNLVAIYSAAVYGRSWISWAALPAGLLGVLFYFARFPDEGEPMIVAMVLLIWLVAWLMGRLWGGVGERERLRAERDLSVELAELRQTRLELEAERTTMSREIHDIIGHTLNVMLVHAGAARRALPANVAQAVEAIQIIETTGRSAMDDLDRVLGLLRADGDQPSRSPLPGITDLHALATSVSGSSLDVTVDVAVAAAAIPKPLQLTVYRIAQEALTNVIKHANASVATVTVGRDGADLVLEVCDDGRGLGSGTGSGRGLSGMRQRAEMHGGTMTTSSSQNGGTALKCRIPMTT